MNALPLLFELAGQEILLRVNGPNLAVSPRDKLTESLTAIILFAACQTAL